MLFFIFYNRHLYFYLFYLISKGIFHLGGLVSKMHISVYMLFTEWRCFCFFSFIEYNLGITNIQCTFWRYYATTTFWRYYGSHLSWVENCSQESYSLAGGQRALGKIDWVPGALSGWGGGSCVILILPPTGPKRASRRGSWECGLPSALEGKELRPCTL